MVRQTLPGLALLLTLGLLTPAAGAPGAKASAPGAAKGVPSDRRVVYQADPDGDGQVQIFTLTLNAPRPVAVTEGPAKSPTIARTGDVFYTRYITPMWGRITKMYHYQWPDGPEVGVTTNELADEHDPCISRDGGVLAFISLRYFQPTVGPQTSATELIAYKRPFEKQRQLTVAANVESNPAVDADGTWIYYTVTFQDGHTEVWRSNFHNSKAERIAGLEDGKITECHQPAVDGKNRWCAYASTRDGNSEIYVKDLTTMKETRLTNAESWDGEPAMSEDGHHIVFVSDRDGDKELFVMNRDGSDVRQLTENSFADDAPMVQ
ncbi:MAG TPA: hypothetical protein VEI97_16255 [bacterium]|nr:hypothetical protein [bacterium]